MVLEETSREFEIFLAYIGEYMFIVFGPILLIISCIGIGSLPLSQNCEFSFIAQQVSFIDVFLLVLCIVLSAVITFFYAT